MKTAVIIFACFLAIESISLNTINEKDEVAFSIRKGFGTVEGYFKKVDYDIEINEGSSNSISGKAQISSVSTGNSTRDKHLQNEDWFFTEKYPQIRIQSKRITKITDNEYSGTFDITIKNKTKSKEIPFGIEVIDGKKHLVATFNLSIEDYEIGGGFVSMLVADQVTVNLNLPFKLHYYET
nr:YceI family protein [uncultured Allomuricauda sp.]